MEENEEVEVEVEKKVVKKKMSVYAVKNVAVETAEQIYDSEENPISDREMLVKIYNDIKRLKEGLLG